MGFRRTRFGLAVLLGRACGGAVGIAGEIENSLGVFISIRRMHVSETVLNRIGSRRDGHQKEGLPFSAMGIRLVILLRRFPLSSERPPVGARSSPR